MGSALLREDDRPQEIPPLMCEKLAAFDRMAHAFRASFAYAEDVHGLRRFPRVSVAATVRYLHALWVCGGTDAILSVPPPSHAAVGAWITEPRRKGAISVIYWWVRCSPSSRML